MLAFYEPAVFYFPGPARSCFSNMADNLSPVTKWLDDSGLLEFQQQFLNEGYDDLSVIAAMTADDLKDIGISKMGHRKKILLKIEELRKTRKEETIQQKLNCATASKTPLIQSGILKSAHTASFYYRIIKYYSIIYGEGTSSVDEQVCV